MPTLISIDPDPPQTGKPLTVCYTFADVPHDSVTLTLDWRPDSIPDGTATVTRDMPCTTVTVPAKATAVFIIDPTGYSDDLGAVVSP